MAAGLAMAIIVLPSIDDLVTTGYGLALLTKVVLVIPVIALGAYNRRRLVPLVSAGAAAAPARRLGTNRRRRAGDPARRRRRHGRAGRPLARPLVGAPPPPVTPCRPGVEVPLSGDAGTASITVAPARAGSNEIRLTLTDPSGQPLEPFETPDGRAHRAELGVGPLRPIVHPFGGGEFHVIADIPLAGTWELSIRVRVSDFDAVDSVDHARDRLGSTAQAVDAGAGDVAAEARRAGTARRASTPDGDRAGRACRCRRRDRRRGRTGVVLARRRRRRARALGAVARRGVAARAGIVDGGRASSVVATVVGAAVVVVVRVRVVDVDDGDELVPTRRVERRPRRASSPAPNPAAARAPAVPGTRRPGRR